MHLVFHFLLVIPLVAQGIRYFAACNYMSCVSTSSFKKSSMKLVNVRGVCFETWISIKISFNNLSPVCCMFMFAHGIFKQSSTEQPCHVLDNHKLFMTLIRGSLRNRNEGDFLEVQVVLVINNFGSNWCTNYLRTILYSQRFTQTICESTWFYAS